MPLLDDAHFDSIAQALSGSRVGWLRMYGNVGDRMIDWATEQFLHRHHVRFGTLNWGGVEGGGDIALDRIDTILVSGGGNLGKVYENCFSLRQRYRSAGKRIVVLPQTMTTESEDLDVFDVVFLRERWSLSRYDTAHLAPDMALAFDPPPIRAARDLDIGVFLREDGESLVEPQAASLGDPALLCQSVLEYLALAGRFRCIYTDRLHFAIAGLHAGCEVHLLPGSYPKNRSMYDTWLESLGCRWCDGVDDIPPVKRPIRPAIAKTFVLPAFGQLPWDCRPRWNDDVRLSDDGVGGLIVHCPEQRDELALAPEAAELANALDGAEDLESLLSMRGTRQEPDLVRRARDIQFVVRALAEHGCLEAGSVQPSGARGRSVSGARRYPNACYDVRVEGVYAGEHGTRVQAYLVPPGAEARALWFEVDDVDASEITDHADPFVLAALMRAMYDGYPLRVSGAPVSAGLVTRLYEFQMVFSSWYPELNRIDVVAEESPPQGVDRKSGIAAFSGGVDSTYTLYRQLTDPDPCWDFGVDRALFTLGYDVFVYNHDDVCALRKRLERLTNPIGVRLSLLTTNLREIFADWKKSHGLAVAASLSLFQRRYRHGLIASTVPYNMLYPWGSNAITDRMMGSDDFGIVHDGAERSRMDKLRYLSKWPDVMAGLRFCFTSEDVVANCGRCQKCIVTAIQLRSLGLPLDCFADPPDDETIEGAFRFLVVGMRIDHLDFHDLVDARNVIRTSGREIAWLPALNHAIETVRDKSLAPPVSVGASARA